MSQRKPSEFERAAETPVRGGFISELWDFLKHNKKWWLLPLLVVILALGAMLTLSSTSLAPFIYAIW